MKYLILFRHAKSSWKYPELSDRERPLNKRGRRDAPKMGKWLKNNIEPPEMVLSSPSVRTLATISKAGHEWGLKGENYHTDQRLFHAGTQELLHIIRSCKDNINSLLIVGHNPGLTELAGQLCPEEAVENIPTSGVFGIKFNTEHWKEATTENAEFLFFQYPKNFSQKAP